MCWNLEVSAVSALFGWATCAFLWWRGGPRDAFYARYLVTFTFTQLIDMALWYQHESAVPGGIKACVAYQQQFGAAPEGDQHVNFVLTKFVLPCVVFAQHAMQLSYPSRRWSGPGERTKLILWHLVPVLGMSFAFACSTLWEGQWPVAGPSLLWGGDFSAWPFSLIQAAALLHSGLVAFDFWLLMRDDTPMLLAHLLPLYAVIGTLAYTEGTIMLGSKWCTYCLLYCFVYIADPLWHGDDKKGGAAKKVN